MDRLDGYQQWEHCITALCGIPLTQAFVEQRIAELTDLHNTRTQQFVSFWGMSHHAKVLGWFEEAKRRLARG
ncbi:MAG: hypothetical protein ACK5Q5_23300 [Planctomycetaceae bacterium]